MQLPHCRWWPWCKLVSVCRNSEICILAEVCIRYVCCSYDVGLGVEDGGGLTVRGHSYGGHRVQLWTAFDWLKNHKKQLKVKQSRQPRVYLGFIRPKTGTTHFGPMAELVGCVFDFIFQNVPVFVPNGRGVPVFGLCPKYFVCIPSQPFTALALINSTS